MIKEPIEFTQYITPDGNVYYFDTHDKFLMTFTGLGMPPIEYITQRGPFQHGESVIDYRLLTRIVQLIHRRNANCRSDYWDARSDLINFLRPNRQTFGSFLPGQLRKILPDGSIRDIDVMIEQGPVFGPRSLNAWDEFGFMESLRFIAHDPTFYDPTEVTATWVTSTESELVFPFTFRSDGSDIGLLFDIGVIDDDLAVTYTGTWLSFPTIEIDGPMSAVIITNVTTGEFIRLNYNIPIGRTVTIALPYGNKTVTDDLGLNLIGAISTDSSLSTFHIAPDPEAAGGVNTINVLGGGTDGNTEVRLCYFTRFIGI